ncbi:MAG: YeiH family putative sulfate export transporter [Bacteroidales bacterium]|nr:YeiH family putative sulfate export transporter [Bacteroidales bacterium]
MVITEKRANVIHGLLLIAGFSFAAFYISNFQWVKNLSLSPLIIGFLIGIVYANCLRNHLPETWVPGIKFCTKQILRLGIILYGFKLTIQNVVAVGVPSLVVDTIIVSGTILLGLLFGKILKIDRETALMTSTGSAICGAAAVLGAEPIVRCEPHKTAVAVSTVVIFGTISMFLYPIMYRAGLLSSLDDMGVAIYTGSTLHEVAHVVGAGNAMDPTGQIGIADNATIVKMIRVMMLAPVLLIMGFCLNRSKKGNAEAINKRGKITIPWFAFGFIGVIILNSAIKFVLSDASFTSQQIFNSALSSIGNFDTFLLTMAMTALGTETSFAKFKQAGAKPFLLAGMLYIWLIFGGYMLCKYLVPCLS